MLRYDRRGFRQVSAAFWRGLAVCLPVLFSVALFASEPLQGDASSLHLADLHDEGGQRFFRSFILPNEPEFAEFKKANSGKTGAFIGVGTFRVLVGASYGRFSEIIMADLDQTVVDFNKLQIQALANATTVEAFFVELEKLAATHESLKFVSLQYVESLQQLRLKDASESFLTNPHAYARLHLMAKRGRIHTVAASLTGEKSFRKIGERLHRAGLSVSVLDVSNAPDYFVMPRYMPMGVKAAVEAFDANLKALPWAPDAVINSTTDQAKIGKPSSTKSWHPMSTPIADYLELYREVVRGRELEDYTWIYGKLYANRNERLCKSIFRGAAQ